VQFSDDRTSSRQRQQAPEWMKNHRQAYDITGGEISREAIVDVAADGVGKSIAIPEPADISTAYFLNLQLFSATGSLLSRNFYWLSSKPDELDYAKTEWYYTPQTSFADFSGLQDLPKATVHATLRPAALHRPAMRRFKSPSKTRKPGGFPNSPPPGEGKSQTEIAGLLGRQLHFLASGEKTGSRRAMFQVRSAGLRSQPCW
jgi:hypothetical protein